MVTVPAVTPVTMPVAPTVAIAVLLLLHVPPVESVPNADVSPRQTLELPVIVDGNGLTTTGCAVKHPVGNV